MNKFFLVVGLLFILGAALEGVLQPWGPTLTEIAVLVLLVGGLLLLGVANVLTELRTHRTRSHGE